jgi:hypothetical protein
MARPMGLTITWWPSMAEMFSNLALIGPTLFSSSTLGPGQHLGITCVCCSTGSRTIYPQPDWPRTYWSRCDEEAAAVWLTTSSVNFGMGVGFGWRHQIAITMAPTPSKPDRFDTAGLLSVWGLRGAKSRPGGDD